MNRYFWGIFLTQFQEIQDNFIFGEGQKINFSFLIFWPDRYFLNDFGKRVDGCVGCTIVPGEFYASISNLDIFLISKPIALAPQQINVAVKEHFGEEDGISVI